jgi:ABC-type nitrate/sulfonate/bicarbonate transport system substrate-binding protein
MKCRACWSILSFKLSLTQSPDSVVFRQQLEGPVAVLNIRDAVVLAPGAVVVRSSPPDTTTALIAIKGALKTLKDLEGKRVAINVINSSAWLHAVAALEKHGVDRTKVRLCNIPAYFRKWPANSQESTCRPGAGHTSEATPISRKR